MACVMESGTREHVVCMCSHVCNPRARETQMRNRQVNHKIQKSNSLNERKLDKLKIYNVKQYVVIQNLTIGVGCA